MLLSILAGMFLPGAAAVTAGFLAAAYPPFIFYSNMKLTECLFGFLFLLTCCLLTRTFRDRDNGSFIWAGIVHGISVLVRAPTLLFPAVMAPLILFTGLRKSLLKGFLLYAAIGAAIISAWSIRNYLALGDTLAVNTGSGTLLWYAVQDDAWNGDEIAVIYPTREYPELANLSRAKMESIVARRVVKRAITHPLWYSGKLARNFWRLWTLPIGKVMLARVSPRLAGLYQAAHYLLLAIALCGLLYISRNNFLAALPSLLYLFYVSLMHSVILGTPRYRLPYDYLMLMFAAGGLVFLYRALLEKKSAPSNGADPASI